MPRYSAEVSPLIGPALSDRSRRRRQKDTIGFAGQPTMVFSSAERLGDGEPGLHAHLRETRAKIRTAVPGIAVSLERPNAVALRQSIAAASEAWMMIGFATDPLNRLAAFVGVEAITNNGLPGRLCRLVQPVRHRQIFGCTRLPRHLIPAARAHSTPSWHPRRIGVEDGEIPVQPKAAEQPAFFELGSASMASAWSACVAPITTWSKTSLRP